MDHGFSQVALKGSSSDASVVWNLPVDVTFKSTNPQGWPRLVVSVYCQDLLGRYVVRGYGSVLVPTVPGRYIRYVRCFTPVASTMLQGFLGWLTGSTPEVRAGCEGRRPPARRLERAPLPPAVLRQQDRGDGRRARGDARAGGRPRARAAAGRLEGPRSARLRDGRPT